MEVATDAARPVVGFLFWVRADELGQAAHESVQRFTKSRCFRPTQSRGSMTRCTPGQKPDGPNTELRSALEIGRAVRHPVWVWPHDLLNSSSMRRIPPP